MVIVLVGLFLPRSVDCSSLLNAGIMALPINSRVGWKIEDAIHDLPVGSYQHHIFSL